MSETARRIYFRTIVTINLQRVIDIMKIIRSSVLFGFNAAWIPACSELTMEYMSKYSSYKH